MPLLPTSHGYLQDGALVWWSDILVIIASLQEMNEQRRMAVSYLAVLSFLFPINMEERFFYIVFIHAENLLLGLCFIDDCQFSFLFSLLLLCSFYCLINFECVSALPVCQPLLCCCVLKFCGICSLYCLSGSSLNYLAPSQICVIVGRLSRLLAANRATLARLRVCETAGMCLVPPGRGR